MSLITRFNTDATLTPVESERKRAEARSGRTTKAAEHLEEMETLYPEQIAASIAATEVYRESGRRDFTSIKRRYKCDTGVVFEKTDSVSAILGCSAKTDGKIAVLNFANFLEPGGGYIYGAMAQEEALCAESTLYNVISEMTDYYEENQDAVRALGELYSNRALYSPGIIFKRGDEVMSVDVISCAAPNATAYLSAGGSQKVNAKTLLERMDFILSIAAEQQVDTLILGAFGCGVFGQNAVTVGGFYKHLLETTYKDVFKTVVFAVMDDPNLNALRDGFTR